MNHGGDGTGQHADEGDIPAHRSPWARPASDEWPASGEWPAPGGDQPTMDLHHRAGAAAATGPRSGQPAPPPPAGAFQPGRPAAGGTGGTDRWEENHEPDEPGHPPIPPTMSYGSAPAMTDAPSRPFSQPPALEPAPVAAPDDHRPLAGTTPSAGTAPARRRRRRWLWALVAAVVGLVLLVVGDRAAVSVAEDQMAKQIRVSVAESLECGAPAPTVRDVHIGGFPFLTQILLGKFEEIGVTIEGIATPGPRISAVQAQLSGIHVPLGDMISGSVGAVPVDDIRATVRLDYADLNTYLAGLPGALQVNPVDGGRRVEISGRTDLWLFGSQEIGGVTTFEVRDNVLTLVPSEVTLRGAINATIPVPVGGLLPPIKIPVGQLPLDLDIVEASTGGAGLSLTATAHDVVLPAAEQPAPRQCPPGNT